MADGGGRFLNGVRYYLFGSELTPTFLCGVAAVIGAVFLYSARAATPLELCPFFAPCFGEAPAQALEAEEISRRSREPSKEPVRRRALSVGGSVRLADDGGHFGRDVSDAATCQTPRRRA